MDINQTVLIVEDETAFLQTMETVFKANGFIVTTAQNGLDGLKKALAEHPSLVVLDLMMPIKDGWSMLEDLRKDEWGKSVPAIVLTSYEPDDDAVGRVMKESPSFYLSKNDTPLDDLVNKAKSILQQGSPTPQK